MAKVLVVDDNPQNRALAQATLEDDGHEVVLAENGEQALFAFDRQRPDCVLLDVRMPGMDGFAVCAKIRELAGGPNTPILFLTALRDVDTFDSALRAGGDDFLTKPVRPTELAVRVQAALKLGRMSAELREHYELVRRQRDDLMRLQLQKEQLTAFVIHDLKNPVNSLDLHAQLLLRNKDLPARARDSVHQIRDEARSLMRLILNLLDISKSEEGQLVPKIERVELAPLANQVLEALDVRARAKDVKLSSAVDASVVRADPDLLRRVLENLVDNAVRHAPETSEVILSAVQQGDSVEIRVSDEGPGVPEAMREKVFDRFVQVEGGPVVARTGRGLGLAFCKLVVEAHGGKVWVEDGEPGAVFCTRLSYAD